MRILVCNDDGIHSPGIAALAQVAAKFGTVQVVAPESERSSSGHAITASHPLSYRRTAIANFTAHRVNGTPADCVSLGTHYWQSVDVVLAGINLGLNLGNAIWHSGTVAAAKQASLLGIRGIALSAPAGADSDLEPLKPWIQRVLEVLLPDPLLPLVNVNVPRTPRGLAWTRVSVRHYERRVIPAKDPLGRDLNWFSFEPTEAAEQGTDRWAVEQGWVSLTPLRIDLTNEEQLTQARIRHPLDEALASVISAPRSSPEDERRVQSDEAPGVSPAVTVLPTESPRG